ncbi:MAG: ferritin-like domain-containing protein [Myxococcales bacterium]|nr:ferritin-like domain-containing protein [Myxococcales bacterium]
MTAGMLDLRAAAQALAPALPEPQHRAAAIATWRGRMVNEYSSAPVFAGLAAQLDAAGAPAWAAEAREMAGEEHRHGALCGAVVEALGGAAVAPAPARDPLPDHPAVDPFEAVTRNLLSVCCLSETVACALITAERAEMAEGPLRDLLGEILADEVGHARLGWRWLAAHGTRWAAPGMAERLGAWLRVAFAHLEAHELANLVPGSPTEPALGLCDAHAARALFYQTVEAVIVPRLEAHGLPAASAWATRHIGA